VFFLQSVFVIASLKGEAIQKKQKHWIASSSISALRYARRRDFVGELVA